MPLSDALAGIPGLGGYLAQRQLNEQQGQSQMQQMQGMLTLASLLQQQQQRQQAMTREEALRRDLAGAKTMEEAIEIGRRHGPEGLKAVAAYAEATKDLRNPPQKNTIVPPGSTVLGPDLKPVFTAQEKPQQFAPPETVRLLQMRDSLPEGHPMRKNIEARIQLLTTRQPQVQVNMPASSDLMQKPDGTYVRVRIGKDGRVEEVPLGGLRPPLTPAERKEETAASEQDAAAARVRARITEMSKLIQGGAMAGATVGPLGLASRIGETAMGAVKQDTPTPAIDFKNQQALLVADIRKMVEKDPNLSNEERRNLMETLGGGIWQTPASGLRALNNVLNYVESKKVSGKSRSAKIESAVPAVGSVEQGYRFKGGDPSKQENWEKVN